MASAKAKLFIAISTLSLSAALSFAPEVHAAPLLEKEPGTAKNGGGACATDFANLSPHGVPTPLTRQESIPLKNKVTDPVLLRQSVKFFDLNQGPRFAIMDLSDGIYVYAIDKSNRLVLIPRSIDPGVDKLAKPDAEFLGSHEGLSKYLEETFKDKPELVAAGEVVKRNGRIMMISNGSGTFRGDSRHLEYAKEKLIAIGFDIDPRTEIRDYSTKRYSDPHGSASQQALAEIEARHNPELLSLLQQARAVMKKIDRQFPDYRKLVAKAMATSDKEKQGRRLEAIGFLGQWLSPQESEAYIIKNASKERLRRWLDDLESMTD